MTQFVLHSRNPTGFEGLKNPMGFDGLLMGITSIGRVKTMAYNS